MIQYIYYDRKNKIFSAANTPDLKLDDWVYVFKVESTRSQLDTFLITCFDISDVSIPPF